MWICKGIPDDDQVYESHNFVWLQRWNSKFWFTTLHSFRFFSLLDQHKERRPKENSRRSSNNIKRSGSFTRWSQVTTILKSHCLLNQSDVQETLFGSAVKAQLLMWMCPWCPYIQRRCSASTKEGTFVVVARLSSLHQSMIRNKKWKLSDNF